MLSDFASERVIITGSVITTAKIHCVLRLIPTSFKRGKQLATGTFFQEPRAALDLASGLTPGGVPVETPGNAAVRPDNAPICPFVPSTGYPAFISLRGGGLLAVDPVRGSPSTISGASIRWSSISG